MSKMKRWQKSCCRISCYSIIFWELLRLNLLLPRETVNQEINNWTQDSFDIQSIKTIDKTKDDFTILAITDIQFDNPFYSKNRCENRHQKYDRQNKSGFDCDRR